MTNTPPTARDFAYFWGAWQQGDRSRAVGLRTMFAAWYGLIEPPHLTGFVDPWPPLQDAFLAVHEQLWAQAQNDVEFLYTVGLMAHLAPWLLGEVKEWEDRSREYRTRYRALSPAGIDPNMFAGDGEYERYFRSQAGVADGY